MRPIASPLIPSMWENVWPAIRESVELSGEQTERSVMAALIYGGMQLWTHGDAYYVTSWTDYPAGRIAYVQFIGGKDAIRWVREARDEFEVWARALGCKEIRIVGRKGWQKLLGLDECMNMMRVTL